MTDLAAFLRALSSAPARALDDFEVPGLGSGEYALPALWAVQQRLRDAHGGRLVDGIADETRAAMDDLWQD